MTDHDHDHPHDHGHHHHGDSSTAIVRAMAVTAVFMGLELAGGWYANSLALLSDGAHMLTDLGAMALSLAAIWIARKPRTAKMSFGYQRAEILGALVSGLAIWLIAGGLVWEAFQRVRSPEEVRGPV
jgi:cobalt-zinc-cadmium efflux system protein